MVLMQSEKCGVKIYPTLLLQGLKQQLYIRVIDCINFTFQLTVAIIKCF